MSLQSTIFSFFGGGEKRTDTYKDSNGKGVFERYNECIGKDMDFMSQEVDEMTYRLNDIYDADIYTLGVICESLGLPYQTLYKGSDIDVIRRIAIHHKGILENRANKDGVKLIAYLILNNVVVNVIEEFPITTFDSSITLDDSKRVFDNSGSVALIFDFDSPLVLSEDEIETIRRIVNFNTPIDCKATIRLNGTII